MPRRRRAGGNGGVQEMNNAEDHLFLEDQGAAVPVRSSMLREKA